MVISQLNTVRWIRIALINFFVLAIIGVILRYKINFPLPAVNQKYLLHGHSHFAFVGWVTLALMVLMVDYLYKQKVKANYNRYRLLLIMNTITGYGMLFTFTLQGYALFSITFSTLSILVSYLFSYYYWRDLRKVNDEPYTILWFKSSLILWAISSIGVFTLAFLMATQIKIQEYYFSAIYFFLHFQYNGWFLFTSIGLMFSYFPLKNKLISKINQRLYRVMVITVAPTYLLSLLWLKLPAYLYWLASTFGAVQLVALLFVIPLFWLVKNDKSLGLSKMTRLLWLLAYACLMIKVGLQALSAIPQLGNFAFGFRPVVIAYLHLCFLGVISFFIIGHFNKLLPNHQKLNKFGVTLFISGVIIQELLLIIQGIKMIGIQLLPQIDILLLIAAIVIATGLAILIIKLRHIKKSTANTIYSG